MFSRALLLETLLIGQHIMIDLFAARDHDAALDTDSETAADLSYRMVGKDKAERASLTPREQEERSIPTFSS